MSQNSSRPEGTCPWEIREEQRAVRRRSDGDEER